METMSVTSQTVRQRVSSRWSITWSLVGHVIDVRRQTISGAAYETRRNRISEGHRTESVIGAR